MMKDPTALVKTMGLTTCLARRWTKGAIRSSLANPGRRVNKARVAGVVGVDVGAGVAVAAVVSKASRPDRRRDSNRTQARRRVPHKVNIRASTKDHATAAETLAAIKVATKVAIAARAIAMIAGLAMDNHAMHAGVIVRHHPHHQRLATTCRPRLRVVAAMAAVIAARASRAMVRPSLDCCMPPAVAS